MGDETHFFSPLRAILAKAVCEFSLAVVCWVALFLSVCIYLGMEVPSVSGQLQELPLSYLFPELKCLFSGCNVSPPLRIFSCLPPF